MNKPKAINPMQLLSDSELLQAYGGSLLMTIPETREEGTEITIQEAVNDFYIIQEEILRRMKGGE